MSKLLAGRYRLLTKLGHGGMGTVWRGRDELLDREVAIKEINRGQNATDDELMVRRSLREARIAARLSHPNIADVYDVIEEDARPWIIMRLVPSRSLGQVIAEDGPLPHAVAARVALDILAALEAAHAAGIVHRDVKPDNILIPEYGGAVLTDFGIAASGDDDWALTRTGAVFGTPAFIAPERATGEGADPASDLWSLGATLYTAVEGRPPFAKRNGMATLLAVVTEEPEPFQRAGVLAPVISGLLRKDPGARLGIGQARVLLGAVLALARTGDSGATAAEAGSGGPALAGASAPTGAAPALAGVSVATGVAAVVDEDSLARVSTGALAGAVGVAPVPRWLDGLRLRTRQAVVAGAVLAVGAAAALALERPAVPRQTEIAKAAVPSVEQPVEQPVQEHGAEPEEEPRLAVPIKRTERVEERPTPGKGGSRDTTRPRRYGNGFVAPDPGGTTVTMTSDSGRDPGWSGPGGNDKPGKDKKGKGNRGRGDSGRG
ncbi:serine/threonine-protein kinase [Nonomuraea sp. NPDC050310]|uniref:serine/threonine-protein kinase n=1 Tax=Nonomuraea sp. NPDC050310 TaxID=3154935 RepID=UPI0033DE54AE